MFAPRQNFAGQFLGLAALLSAASFAQAQVSLPPSAGPLPPVPVSTSPVTSSYIVGPQDILTITVMKHPEFSVQKAVVSQNGLIAVPVVGTIKAEGKSLEQLDGEITRRFRARLRNPEVAITIETPRPRSVYLAGEVKTPGAYEVKANWRLTQVLAAAGGLSVGNELASVVVNRNNRNIVDTPITPLLLEPNHTFNIVVQSGDTIRVYERKAAVNITGAVMRPGIYSVPRDSGIAEALSLAGGPKPTAALGRANLRRDGVDQPLDLYRLLIRGVQTGNVTLRSGDTISIPELRGITVIGEVTTPGSYPLDDGRNPRISDAIAAAGGLKIKPEQARISIARAGASGQMVTQNIDPIALIELSSPAQNRPLRDGDIVSVTSVKRNTVYISGEVKVPGAYEVSEGDGIPEVISRAGGPTQDASLAQVVVTRRDGTKTTVNTAAALLSGADRTPVVVKDGDVIVVPKSKNRILVVGAVARPGTYAMPEDRELTIGDALSLAGGSQNNAKKLTLMRPAGEKVESTVIRLDKPEKNALGVNQLLQAGDVLYIPEGKPHQSTLDTIGNFLPGLAWIVR